MRRASVMFAVVATAAGVLPVLGASTRGRGASPAGRVRRRLLGAAVEHELADPAAGQAQDDGQRPALRHRPVRHPAATVAALHAAGRKVACYFSAGSFEDWRPDAAQFPAAVKGGGNGWPGERWLDIRRLDILMPIMEARLNLCKQKGFDSVDPDNVDGYTNTTGFPLTAADQLAYNASIANAAHARGLTVALKNDLNQIPQLVPYFDWALNEQCFAVRRVRAAHAVHRGGQGRDEHRVQARARRSSARRRTRGTSTR